MEKHKQKSETFRAFGGACSLDEEPSLSPDQPVSQQPVVGGKWDSALGQGVRPTGIVQTARTRISRPAWVLVKYSCNLMDLLPCRSGSMRRKCSSSARRISPCLQQGSYEHQGTSSSSCGIESQKLSDTPRPLQWYKHPQVLVPFSHTPLGTASGCLFVLMFSLQIPLDP